MTPNNTTKGKIVKKAWVAVHKDYQDELRYFCGEMTISEKKKDIEHMVGRASNMIIIPCEIHYFRSK